VAILEAYCQVDCKADEPSERADCSTRVDTSELEHFGKDAADAERRTLRSGDEDLTEEIDDIVLTHGDGNEQIC